MNGKQVNPIGKGSFLSEFPSSDKEYRLARLHQTRAVFIWLGGTALFFSTSMYRGSKSEVPIQIVGGSISFSSIFLSIKARKHLHKSVLIYNEEIKK